MTDLIPTDEALRIAYRLGVVRLIATGLEAIDAANLAEPRNRTDDAEQILDEYLDMTRPALDEHRLIGLGWTPPCTPDECHCGPRPNCTDPEQRPVANDQDPDHGSWCSMPRGHAGSCNEALAPF